LNWWRGGGPLQTLVTSTIGAGISPDGTRVVTAGSDHALHLLDSATMRELLVLGDLTYGLLDACFVAGGERVAALSHRWDSPTYVYVWSAPPEARLPR
jgi:hypothetical protein